MADLSPVDTRLRRSPLPHDLHPRHLLRAPAISRWNAGVGVRVALTSASLLVLLIGANLATPLYPMLQKQLALTPVDTTILFTTYVLALVPTMIAVGHWSDRLGRRALVLPAVALAILGDAVFASAGSLSALLAGRAVHGVAVGMITGAAGAALAEMMPGRPALAARLTLASTSFGVAAGPVVGGLLSQSDHPVGTPFAVHAVVLLALCLPLALVHPRRAAAEPGPFRELLKPRRMSIPARGRREFILASTAGFLSYAVFGIYLSLAPSYSASLLHSDSRVVGGLVAALLLGSSALAQLLSPATGRRSVIAAGMVGLAVGLGLVVLAGELGSAPLLIGGSLLGGASQGVAFRVWFTSAASLMDADRRASQLSAFYVIAYLGSTVPILGVGLLAQRTGIQSAVAVFAGAAAVGCLVLAVLALRPVQK